MLARNLIFKLLVMILIPIGAVAWAVGLRLETVVIAGASVILYHLVQDYLILPRLLKEDNVFSEETPGTLVELHEEPQFDLGEERKAG